MFIFEQFPVYIKTEQLQSVIKKLIIDRRLDKNTADQLRRSSLSILLNIAEGSGRHTPREKASFYLIARGSCYECVAVIKLLKLEDSGNEILDALYAEFTEISKMLSGMIKKFHSYTS